MPVNGLDSFRLFESDSFVQAIFGVHISLQILMRKMIFLILPSFPSGSSHRVCSKAYHLDNWQYLFYSLRLHFVCASSPFVKDGLK